MSYNDVADLSSFVYLTEKTQFLDPDGVGDGAVVDNEENVLRRLRDGLLCHMHAEGGGGAHGCLRNKNGAEKSRGLVRHLRGECRRRESSAPRFRAAQAQRK